MAGTITSIIRTLFVSEGAPDVIKSTDALGRAQTRLGNASAGNGRQFAAQSSGMGGLVAAYAGAAATIFTLQAAFTALSNAASAENIVKGTNALAANIGQSGPQILASIQSITQGQLTLAQASENTNIALSAGFNTDQIEKLNRVAMGASQALGRDLTDSVTRLTKGTAKLEPELLDELGIFTRIDPAVQAYAKSMNISASSLTNFEKRQAFANAVIEEGTRKFSAIDVSAPSAQKSLNQLNVEVQQLSTQFMQFVTEALLPLVNFFKNDIGNSLLLFGGIMALVFGKGIGIVKGWVSGNLANLSSFALELAKISEQVKGNFTGMTSAVTAFSAKMVSEGGLAGKAASLMTLNPGLTQTAADKLAGTGSATQLTGAGAKQARTDYIAARDRFSGIAGGAIPDLTQRKKDVDTFKASLTRLSAAGKDNTLIFQRTSAMINILEGSINGASTSAKLFAGAATFMAGAARVASIAFTTLNVALGGVMAVVTVAQLAGTLLGVDLLGKIRDAITGVTQAAENLRNGFIGLATDAAGGGAAITQALKAAGASDKDLEKTNDRLLAIKSNLAETAKDKLMPVLINKAMMANPQGGSLAAQSAALTKLMTPDTETANMITQQESLLVTQKLIDLKKELANTPITDDTELSRLNQEIIYYGAIKDQLDKYGDSLNGVIGAVSRLSGLDVSTVGKIFTSKDNELIYNTFETIQNGSAGVVNLSKHLSILGMVLTPLANGQYSFDALSDQQKDYINSSTLLVSTLDSLHTGFTQGTITVDEYAAKVNGAQQQLNKIATSSAAQTANKKALDTAFASTGESGHGAYHQLQNDINAAADSVKRAREELDKMKEGLKNFKIADNILSSVQSTFSGQIGEVDKANMSGLVSLSGDLAKNTNEQRINQTAILSSVIKENEHNQQSVAQHHGIAVLNGEQLRIQEASITAKKAFAGQLIQDYQETLKLIEAEKKRTIELQNQLNLLNQQNKISLMSSQAKLGATYAQVAQNAQERGIQLQQTGLDNLTAENSLSLQRIKNANEVASIEADIANIRGSGNAAQDAAALESIKNQTKLNAAQHQVITMDRDLTATKQQIEDKKRANIDLEKQIAIDNYNMAVKAIKASGGASAAATKAKLDDLDRQKKELGAQAGMMQQENTQKLAIFDKETRLQKDKIQADINKLKNDERILAATALLDKARIDAQIQASSFDNKTIQAQIAGYQSFSTSVNGMLDATRTFADSISELLGYLGGSEAADKIKQSVSNLPKDQADNLTGLTSQLKGNIELQNQIYTKTKTQIDDVYNLEKQGMDTQIAGLQDQLKDVGTLREAQRAGVLTQQQAAAEEILHNIKMIDLQKAKIELEGKASGSDITAQLDQAKAKLQQDLADLGYSAEDLDASLNVMLQTMLAVKDNISSGVVSGLMDLNNALFTSTDNTKTFGERLRDAFSSMLLSIEQTVFNKLIATPIGDFIAEWVSTNVLSKILASTAASTATSGVSTGVGAAANAAAATAAGALVGGAYAAAGTAVSVASAATMVPISGAGIAISGALTALGTTVAASAAVVAAQLAAASATATAGMFIAGGGTVHRAGGGSIPGYASGNMVRDRVPAMLEPGEFVIRKPMVAKIGASALAEMNATGKTPSSAPVINIKNEGSPKDATASAPRFDGEKYVIDIVMRDLANNGPIRKSLRGGAI